MRARLGLGSDPHDARDNILAGTYYLRLMHDRFGYPGLFGAYNAGPARYAAFLAGKSRLPRETRAYLANVGGPIGTHTRSAEREHDGKLFFALQSDARGETSSSTPQSVLFIPLRGEVSVSSVGAAP